MTPRELQILRRLHHAVAWHGTSELVRVEAGQIRELINLVWAETKRADVAEAMIPEGTLVTPAGERRLDRVPPRQPALARRPTPPAGHLTYKILPNLGGP